jgi:hypothetical protein
MQGLYKIKKDGAWFCVVTVHSETVQFRSTRRSVCAGWIEDNTPARAGSC